MLSRRVPQEQSNAIDTDPMEVVHVCQKIYQIIQHLIVFLPLHSNCMQRALAVYQYLVSIGIPATFVVGVRVSPYSFHCWIEYCGKVVFDSPQQSQQYQMKTVNLNELLVDKISDFRG